MTTLSQTSRRRTALRLPSLRRHVLGAGAVLFGLVLAPVALTSMIGSADDALPSGTVSVAALDVPVPSPLDRPVEQLPDLLDDSVLIGDNPTATIARTDETVDALGNSIDASPSATPSGPDPSAPRRFDLSGSSPGLDASLVRESQFGPIPAPNASGLTPLKAYRRTARTVSGRKPVSLVIGGLGINGPITQRAIDELPAEITLSFAAHATGLQGWIDQARAAGHEVLLEIPMESQDFDENEAGAERTLRSTGSVEANRRNLHNVLSRAQGYAGVINYNGDVVLNRSDIMAPVLSELKASGLGVIADGSVDSPSLSALARSIDLPFAQGFGLIDPTPDTSVIDARLSALRQQATVSPGTVGVGFAFPQTIDVVKGWTATLADDGLVLVPATAALR